MAARKASATQPEEHTPETNEEPQEKKQTAKPTGMVKVKNNGRFFLRQPSTGIRIDAGSVEELKNDNWLQLQIDRRLMERA